MNSIRHLSVHSFLYVLRLTILLVFCSQPFQTAGQTRKDVEQMPLRAVKLTATELLIVQKGLSQIPKEGYAYLTIYFDGSDFKIFEGTSWNSITHKSLAKWIADN
jgi:hypothetical protein